MFTLVAVPVGWYWRGCLLQNGRGLGNSGASKIAGVVRENVRAVLDVSHYCSMLKVIDTIQAAASASARCMLVYKITGCLRGAANTNALLECQSIHLQRELHALHMTGSLENDTRVTILQGPRDAHTRPVAA
jgi:hypothetical protein